MYVCQINVCAKVCVFMYECGMFVGILQVNMFKLIRYYSKE